MSSDESLKTQIDDLLANLKSSAGNPQSVQDLSSASGLPVADVQKWLSILEKNGQVKIENRLSGIFASWVGEPARAKPAAPEAVDVGETTTISDLPSNPAIDLAREREQLAQGRISRPEPAKESKERLRHKIILEEADADLAEVGEKIQKINTLISQLKQKRMAAKQEAIRAEADARLKADQEQLALAEAQAAEKQAQDEAEAAARAEAKERLEAERKAELEARRLAKKQEAEAKRLERQKAAEERKALLEKKRLARKAGLEAKKQAAAEKRAAELEARRLAREQESEAKRLAEMEHGKAAAQGLPVQVPGDADSSTLSDEESLVQAPQSSVVIKPLAYSPKRRAKIGKIKRPEPLQPTAVSLQFSEKLARHVRKIVHQTQEIEKLKMEKEKLLSEHYLPLQRKLEVEIETISDRVLRMEKNILNMHQRASELPSKVTNVEKLQISTIKAHSEMKRAYDEAVALVEESTRLLSEERERMEVMVDQSRQEIASHRSKTEELEGTLRRISDMERQAEDMVISARAALAEQAERLASAEKNAQELSQLKGEITESVSGIKREISTAKGALTSLEKQMQQMRQIELWADSIRQEYDKKMLEIDDYIRNGNQEYESLRESVEANFVRRYLRELRALTDGYSFEFNQAKNMEGNLDQRISDEKKKLDDLLEEGRKISYLYEMQSREVPGADKFESHAENFRSISEIASQRTQLEQMIAQVVGKQSEYQPKDAKLWPNEARKVAQARKAEPRPKSGGRKMVPKLKAKKKGRR